MNAWTVVATVIEMIATMGAGAASWGMAYEAEVPEAIRK